MSEVANTAGKAQITRVLTYLHSVVICAFPAVLATLDTIFDAKVVCNVVQN